MDRKEQAYAKQALLGVKDWDAFQAVIRYWSRPRQPEVPARLSIMAKRHR
jgi:hypothetical protein